MIAEANDEGRAPLDDDVVVVEHTDAAGPAAGEPAKSRRNVAGTPGRFTLGARQFLNSRILPCSIVKISPQAITFDATVTAKVGDWVIARFEHLGQFEGPILQIAKRTVSMRIVATQQEREKVAAKLAWFEDGNRAERRKYERFVPEMPHSFVALANGETLPCTVVDYSVGGAAVLADVAPAKGTALRIAKVVGEVVRHFNGGFAVNFPTVQDPASIEALLCTGRA
jgi:hypothetical protein